MRDALLVAKKLTCPNVSIIVTNFNYGKYVARCLRSCLAQRNIDHEVILVDDASNDCSKDAVVPFINDIRSTWLTKNVGVAAASNVGIKSAIGQFVIRVDADDFVNADMCHFLSTYLNANHDAFCVSCDYVIVDEYENVIERRYAEVEPISCGVMYRRDLLLAYGAYDPMFRHREEEELRKRLGDKYRIHHLRIPFYRYRMHETNKTKSIEYRETAI